MIVQVSAVLNRIVTVNNSPIQGLHSPGQSYSTYLWHDCWVQTIYFDNLE